jgi:hypothetical protein
VFLFRNIQNSKFFWSRVYRNLIIFFQDILKDINAKVAEKERKQRLFEIYNRVDPKSTLMHNGRKFKKSDILLSDRRLMFEGVATLQQSRNRSLQINVIVLSDILFFLHENNQKFYFITPENKVRQNQTSFSFPLNFINHIEIFECLNGSGISFSPCQIIN